MTRHTRSASCGHCTGPKVFIVDFLPYFSFLKRKKNFFFTKCFPFEDSLKCFIQACVARVCMKYISCWCMLTFCSYQYLIEISMYWKVRSAWAWFKSKWIFSKKKPNNNQPQCFFKDLIDSKDKCECKNGIPRLGWLKGSSLKKDLEHLCFWSSSLRPGQEESCVMCACWAMPKKKKKTLCQILAPHGLKLTAEMHEWCAHGWCRRSHGSWCVGVCDGLCCLLPCGRVSVSVLCCVLFVPCMSPLASPPASLPWGLGERMPVVWNSACAFAALQSAGFLWVWGSLSVFLSLYAPAVFVFLFFFKATCPFAFHLLIH